LILCAPHTHTHCLKWMHNTQVMPVHPFHWHIYELLNFNKILYWIYIEV
jgi:hypothetical protein